MKSRALIFRTGAFLATVFLTQPALSQSRPPNSGASTTVLTSLDEAVALAIERSPALRAAEAKRRASAGERRQAASRPNPELSVEAENLVGSGPYTGLRSTEITFGLSQRIETGGKWTARVSVADAGIALTDQEYEVAKRELGREVRKTYTEAVAAGRSLEIEAERAKLARDVVRVAQERVTAGSEPIVQVRKAEIALSTAEIARIRAAREYEGAIRTLAALVNDDGPVRLSPSQPWFDDIGPALRPEPASDRQAYVRDSPDYRRWDAEIGRNRAVLELERANVAPDVTVSAGLRRFRETDDTAFVVGFSIPLPIFNTNRGAVEKAAGDLARSEFEARQARSTLSLTLAEAESKHALAWQEATMLRTSVLPAAEQSYRFAREGYAAGKFPFLEVLDAQRTLAELRARLVEVLRDVHIQRGEVERFVGANQEAPEQPARPRWEPRSKR